MEQDTKYINCLILSLVKMFNRLNNFINIIINLSHMTSFFSKPIWTINNINTFTKTKQICASTSGR